MDQEGGDLLYRIHNHHDDDTLSSADGRVWSEKEKGENCQVCGSLTFKKNGRMELWDGEKTDNRPDPKIIAYFHPECAKKYFADKEQPSENNIQIKEKLLRNLDKICLDPMGDLANAELLKQENAEWYYKKGNYGSGGSIGEWINKAHHVEIENEEIDLDNIFPGLDGYYEVKKALIEEIKQNLSEWKIMKGGEKYMGSNNWIVKHQSGRRHWKLGFRHIWDDKLRNEMRKEWDKIEATLKGSSLPIDNQESNTNEIEWIKSYFQKKGIKKITLSDNGELVITYNNNEIKNSHQITPKLQAIKDYCQKYNKKEIGWDDNSTNTNSQSGNKYVWLVGGISVGIIISAILVFSLRRKKKKIN